MGTFLLGGLLTVVFASVLIGAIILVIYVSDRMFGEIGVVISLLVMLFIVGGLIITIGV